MKKGAALSEVKKTLSGGDTSVDSARFHDKVILEKISISAKESYYLYRERYYKEHGAYPAVEGHMIKSAEVKVLEDTVRKQRYFKLPFQIFSVDFGFQQLTYAENQSLKIDIIKSASSDVYSEIAVTANRPKAYLEEGKVIVARLADQYTDLIFRGVPSIESLTEDEEIPIPDFLMNGVVKECVQHFMAQGKEDGVTDNYDQRL